MSKGAPPLLGDKALARLIPRSVAIPIVVTFQVKAMVEWDTDDDGYPLPWNSLSLATRKLNHAIVKANLDRFEDWVGSDQPLIDGGGSFVLETAELVSESPSDMPVVRYSGNIVIKPGNKPSTFICNISQSRNMVSEMVSGVFAHYEFAGDDSASIVSLEFPLPQADLRTPWRAYADASQKRWEAEMAKQKEEEEEKEAQAKQQAELKTRAKNGSSKKKQKK